jgi:hypothetical protein
MLCAAPLTRLAALGTLSRSVGEGGPSPKGWVGEGVAASARSVQLIPKIAFSPRLSRGERFPGRCRQSSPGSPPNDRGPAHRRPPG